MAHVGKRVKLKKWVIKAFHLFAQEPIIMSKKTDFGGAHSQKKGHYQLLS